MNIIAKSLGTKNTKNFWMNMDSKCRAEARDLIDTLIPGLKAGIK